MVLPLNQIIQGDSIEVMSTLPDKCIDVIFADPPYNLQLPNPLWRPNQTLVDAVDDEWDQFESYSEYDAFTRNWLIQAQRILKDKSSIWISGTYHNIYRVGAIMQDLGFWVLNMVTWFKPNAMPNFNGTRLKNDVELVIWAKKSEASTYHFNYQLMKQFNDGKQLGSVWAIKACGGKERLVDGDGNKLHSTQKPEALLERILLASAKPHFTILDPFSGSGTTAAVAKKLHMNWIGIERDARYIDASQQRIDAMQALPLDDATMQLLIEDNPKRVEFKALIEHGYIQVGQSLYLDNSNITAQVLPDGHLKYKGNSGSIHKLGKQLRGTETCNGWKHWHYKDAKTGKLTVIDHLRQQFREQHQSNRD